MFDSEHKSFRRHRWHITAAFAFVFGLVGLIVGWSMDSNHPDDRLTDILFPTLTFSTTGLLIGYVVSLVVYQRFGWLEALASLAIPPIFFWGVVSAKSANWITVTCLGFILLGLLSWLVFRIWQMAQRNR